MSTQENEYQVCVLFDASVNTTVRAATPEAAAQEAEEQTDGAQCLCHQCSSQLDTADPYGVHVYQNDKLVLDTTRAGELEAENAALKARVAALKARVAELETLSVTNILIAITPGEDGMGHEVYATSVDEVVEKLSDLGSRLEDYELGVSVSPLARADRKDAKRYRWLCRNKSVTLLTGFFGNGCVNKSFSDMESVIDESLAAEKGSEE